MNPTFEDIKPFLSERGAMEVELAALRWQVGVLSLPAAEPDAGDEPTS